MNSERYQRIQVLLQSALEKELGERSAYLAQACGEDNALRREVESLIVSSERARSFLESPVGEIAAHLLPDDQAKLIGGQALGYYKVVSQIGSGGMGEVYLAEDTRLKRKVRSSFCVRILPKIANGSAVSSMRRMRCHP